MVINRGFYPGEEGLSRFGVVVFGVARGWLIKWIILSKCHACDSTVLRDKKVNPLASEQFPLRIPREQDGHVERDRLARE